MDGGHDKLQYLQLRGFFEFAAGFGPFGGGELGDHVVLGARQAGERSPR